MAFRETIAGVVYFFGDDGQHGSELWRTDASSAGTYMVKDINPSGDAFDLNRVTRIGNEMHFVPDDDGVCGYHSDGSYTVCDLWKSDGTAAGTVEVTNFGTFSDWVSDPYYPTAVGNTLLFYRWRQLWKIASPGGTPEFVYDFANPGDPGGLGPSTSVWPDVVVGDKLVMRRSLPIPNASYPHEVHEELWTTDGTAAGTRRVFRTTDDYAAEIYPGDLKDALIGKTAYFYAAEWVSDPSSSLGTELYRIEIRPATQHPLCTPVKARASTKATPSAARAISATGEPTRGPERLTTETAARHSP